MRELVWALRRSVSVLRKIRSLDLPEDLKARIRKTYLRTILLERYDSQNRIADIAGYNVKFCSYASCAYLFNEIFVDQEYFFPPNNKRPFIVDCGSNIGMSVLYFKMIYPASEILAFEPDPEAFQCLEANVRVNELGSIQAHRKALSGKEGHIDLYYDKADRGCLSMSVLRERLPKQKQIVEAVRLSSYVDREVDFLKMDVEGAERDIIEDLSSEGKLGHIQQMAIEFHHHVVADADELSHILRLLEENGFGYQIQSDMGRPFRRQQFQDILIYAYRKDRTT